MSISGLGGVIIQRIGRDQSRLLLKLRVNLCDSIKLLFCRDRLTRQLSSDLRIQLSKAVPESLSPRTKLSKTGNERSCALVLQGSRTVRNLLCAIYGCLRRS